MAVLDYLSKVVLRPFIKEIGKNNAFDPRIDIDPERQAIIDAVEYIEDEDEAAEVAVEEPDGLLAQLRAQGLPIDEGHASLGMVYTNQEGDKEVDED